MLRNDGFRMRSRQGGWITAAISAASAIMGGSAKKKAAKQEAAYRAQELKLQEGELAIARQQEARAGELYRHYADTFMPAERQLVDTAFGDELSPANAESRAISDTRQALGSSREISMRNMRRFGVNPASGAYQGLERDLALEGAKMESGNRTRAREGVRDKNFARQMDTMALGRGLPAVSSSMLSSAQYGLGSAAGRAAAGTRNAEGLSAAAGEDFGASLAELASEAYDLYKGRKGSGSTAPAGRSGSWG